MAEEKITKTLSSAAFAPKPGEIYEPYISEEENIAEFTLKAVIVGAVFGIIFGAANAYLGLKVGITVSTSVPIAVMTVGFFRLVKPILGKASILEHNISQTVGSASSSLASGIIFTLPALFLWGLDPSIFSITVIGFTGGLLGILFMIPLRRFLIVKEHGVLPYPEGTACAEVLVASEVGGTHAKTVFIGLGVGAVFKGMMSFGNFWSENVKWAIPGLPKGKVGFHLLPALLGVGYILGYRVSGVMVSGALISSVVLIPLIAYFGGGLTSVIAPEPIKLIGEMSTGEIWSRYIRYIGAGAVATGGLISLIKAIPTIISSFKVGLSQIRKRIGSDEIAEKRTEIDLNMKYVLGGVLLIAVFIALSPQIISTVDSFMLRAVGAFFIIVCAFFFVTVSSRIVGLIGVTSNPTSGMTIATLLLVSSIFVLLGWTDDIGKAAALTVGAVVAVAASIAGDTSQDLKTGYLLGATPYRQQIGEMIGAGTAAFFIAMTVMALHQVYGFGSEELPAPQATLMKVVIEGVLSADLPWVLVLTGVAFALVAEILSIPSLPLAVGIYLPISTLTPIFLGGLIRRYVEHKSKDDEKLLKHRRERGILLGSGFVAGDGIMGVVIAFYALKIGGRPSWDFRAWMGGMDSYISFGIFLFLAYYLLRTAMSRPERT